MKCVLGIDLGSTTTKAVLLDEAGAVVGQGITNSRSNYEVACAVAREEALTAARLSLLGRALNTLEDGRRELVLPVKGRLPEAFRLELYLDQLDDLREELDRSVAQVPSEPLRSSLGDATREILDDMAAGAPALFGEGCARRSDFFRDLAAAAFMAGAERACASGRLPFERLAGSFDRAILNVETRMTPRPFESVLRRAVQSAASGTPEAMEAIVTAARDTSIEEAACVGTGYGRQTLPFPKEAVRSEILCHGRGAHALFPRTRTVLDIGGQDTKAIQTDESGVVTSFQMNDRCAAGCGRYLGYIADELGLGLHELGPLALRAHRVIRVNSTCTVFAGAELRERLALGQRREDILAGLHRAMMLRAMSLLARSGGVRDEFTFTGGVCRNEMATSVLHDLVEEHYGRDVTVNIHPESIYMGARGAALFALDDLRAGRGRVPPRFAEQAPPEPDPPCGRSEPATRLDAQQP
ncbi:MAG TPA: BadF/BadG/BcrA/BcrD ATPase family protein [Vicinamibacterales bacterium]|nr:BadF/BadG/BcrA/BcrD ATPase family protein [Vicinamibacterales bacterium]